MRARSEYSYDELLISTAKQAIQEIERFQESSVSELVKCYLEYRKCSLLFYMGYCDETYEKSSGNFSALIEEHDKLMQYFNAAHVYLSNESKCYLYNMEGEARSKIVHYHLYSGGSKNDEMIAIANQAVKDCQKSCDLSIAYADNTLKSTFYRDCGCAMERRERLTEEDEHKDIIEKYEKALNFLVNDATCDIAARKNAYYVLLSYYKRYVDKNLKYIEKNVDVEGTLNGISDFLGDLTEISKKMARISIIAMSDFPNISSMHAFYGFSCAYQAVLELKNENRANTTKYIAEIEAVKADMKIIGVDDPFCKQLGQWADQLNKYLVEVERAEEDGGTVSIRDD